MKGNTWDIVMQELQGIERTSNNHFRINVMAMDKVKDVKERSIRGYTYSLKLQVNSIYEGYLFL